MHITAEATVTIFSRRICDAVDMQEFLLLVYKGVWVCVCVYKIINKNIKWTEEN